ncbi:bifunctional diaminohydroxyphosphoribosylaminopyrimidine deaminase/5-amino-6-(5-phosphoribosylamino)uracil reductase RibD [Flavobacteriaceae bacterium F89]|uniref:Riboflavin biosynthesis protein RibD n=1 Tax=Cerina litoralis TaxID=2874477 RepID=A0AAE3EWP8_9FLAO|nr:bifunctional diaminohydroxyphosphoribosylaminopyrimidine deaminase/5-amino-6-(5-phosphoribosylamino)uracil reductase RibD [Cerina litoralis]
MKIHEKYILRCIQVAKNGLGTTFPNPMVGSVVVYQEKIIGEGYTSRYGGPHAEVNAISSVANPSFLENATLYVTLEPCSHYGKTPPCADLIVKHKIPRVVIGIKDPNTKVEGRGIQKLKEAGCQVVVGILEKDCREHHIRFLTFHEKKRPFIILKWAQSLDGFMAPESKNRDSIPQPYWITNIRSRQLVHQWRSEEQAIMVGTNTVRVDNPELNVRSWHGNSPTRVVVDRKLKIEQQSHILDGSIKTLVFTEIEKTDQYLPGVDYRVIDFSKNVMAQLCDALYENNILSIIIEGGAKTLQSFIDAGLWDEARIFTGETQFAKGLKSPWISGKLRESVKLHGDTLKILRNG